MNAKQKGRAVVLALVLALILSVPVLARVKDGVVIGRNLKYDNWDYYAQYQWVMEGMKSPAGRYIMVIIPPGPDSGMLFDQYQKALSEMEQSIQTAVPNE